jgi:RNA polymerase sigma-B factor
MSGDPTRTRTRTSGGVEPPGGEVPNCSSAAQRLSESTREESRRLVTYLPLVDTAPGASATAAALRDLVRSARSGCSSRSTGSTQREVEFSTCATRRSSARSSASTARQGWAIRVPRRLQLRGRRDQCRPRPGSVHGAAAEDRLLGRGILEDRVGNAYSTHPRRQRRRRTVRRCSTPWVEDGNLEHVEIESIKPLLDRLRGREKRILLLRFFKNMTQSQSPRRSASPRCVSACSPGPSSSCASLEARAAGAARTTPRRRPARWSGRVQHADERGQRDEQDDDGDEGGPTAPSERQHADQFGGHHQPARPRPPGTFPRAEASPKTPRTTKNSRS